MRTWANAEKEWKTLQEILQGDAEDRRRILYFRDVAVGWMEATDTDVLSTVRDNEFTLPEGDASGRLMDRRPCPNPPEGFEWQATLEVANPRKRMQHPPDITDLGARPPPEPEPKYTADRRTASALVCKTFTSSTIHQCCRAKR